MKNLRDLKTPQEKLEALEYFYRQYGTGKGLRADFKDHQGFVGCQQWIFTPSNIIDINRFNIVNYNDYTWAVIINVELIHKLEQLGVEVCNIKFYSDCEWKSNWAIQMNLDPANVYTLPSDKKELRRYIKMTEKNVDFVLNNVPFGMFKEFKALGQKLARQKVLIISGSRDYHNGDAFDNVEYYQYLGSCFPTAKITASMAIIDPNGVDHLNIIDGQGNVHRVDPNPEVTPGEDMDVWIFATDVLNKKLPGYVNAEKGQIDRKGSNIDPNGIPVIFSAGKNGEEFSNTNRALTVADLVKDHTKFCWATIDQSQKNLIGGLGKHKVVVTHAANEPGHLGNPKYAGPDWGCGTNCWFIPCADEADARECIKYLTHPDVVKLVKGLKSSVTSNSKAVWKRIPHHSQASNWIANYA